MTSVSVNSTRVIGIPYRCSRCTQRMFSSSVRRLQPQKSLNRGTARLRSRRLIELRGPQASQFLQGLTTANIPSEAAKSPQAIYSAFLNAQGRLLQDVYIYQLPPDSGLVSPSPSKWASENEQNFVIEVDAEQSTNLMKWLKKYKLRAKVALREVPIGEINVYSSWDDAKSVDDMLSEATKEHRATSVALSDTRAPGLGLRILATQAQLSEYLQDSVASIPEDTSAEQQYKIRRYLFGVPEGQHELAYETSLVHDSNIDYMGGVDFRKGCYVGQELVIRTQHTGVVRKRILPCVLYSSGETEPQSIEYMDRDYSYLSHGLDIKNAAEQSKKARSKGKWLGSVGNVGLALCRLEDMAGIGPAGDALEGWESKEWTIDQSEGNSTRVKAFVPTWWRERIQSIKLGEHGKAT